MPLRPTLPPKSGYIEVEIDGVRQYQKVKTEQDIKIEQLEAINANLDEIVVDLAYRLILLEYGVI